MKESMLFWISRIIYLFPTSAISRCNTPIVMNLKKHREWLNLRKHHEPSTTRPWLSLGRWWHIRLLRFAFEERVLQIYIQQSNIGQERVSQKCSAMECRMKAKTNLCLSHLNHYMVHESDRTLIQKNGGGHQSSVSSQLISVKEKGGGEGGIFLTRGSYP